MENINANIDMVIGNKIRLPSSSSPANSDVRYGKLTKNL